MKFRYFSIILISLIFLLGVSIVCAEEFDLSGFSFEVPKGYSINFTSDNSTTLVQNNSSNYTVFIYTNDIDYESAKISRQSAGFNFISEDNYTTENNITINQQNYVKNESYFSFYSFKINETSFLMGYVFPVDDNNTENENNPVESIIKSIK
ncbi:hypothetical protein [Methanobrevibacter sp.]